MKKMPKRTFPPHVTVYVKREDIHTWKRAKQLSARSFEHSLSSLVAQGLVLVLDQVDRSGRLK